MGERDSSLTRVQPCLNGLLDRERTGNGWLQRLCEMAVSQRSAAILPQHPGCLIREETPDAGSRIGKVFERIVPPPPAFLRWLLINPGLMQVRDPDTFGAKGEDSHEWRRKLFAGSPQEQQEAQAEGLRQLELVGAEGSARRWWAFEGFSHVDACFIAENLVLFIEGKRTEAVSPATNWFDKRSQLWRNVEVAREFAKGRQYAVLLAVESQEDGEGALHTAEASLERSYPHLDAAARTDLSKHMLGFVTWSEVVTEFGLPESCLIDKVAR